MHPQSIPLIHFYCHQMRIFFMAHYHYAIGYLKSPSVSCFDGPSSIFHHHYFHQSYDRHLPSSCGTNYYFSVKNLVYLEINYSIHLYCNLFTQIYQNQYCAYDWVQMLRFLLNYAFNFHDQRKGPLLPSYLLKLYLTSEIYELNVLSFLFLQFFSLHEPKHCADACYLDFIAGQKESFRIFSEKELNIYDLVIYHHLYLVS